MEEGRIDLEWRRDLNGDGMWLIDLGIILISFSHSMRNNIGSSGACSLSEALKVNSSLTQLNLGMSFLFDTMIVDHHITLHEEQYW